MTDKAGVARIDNGLRHSAISYQGWGSAKNRQGPVGSPQVKEKDPDQQKRGRRRPCGDERDDSRPLAQGQENIGAGEKADKQKKAAGNSAEHSPPGKNDAHWAGH